MDSTEGIDDILNGEPADEVIQPDQPENTDRPRDEHGRFTSKGDDDPAPADDGAPPAPSDDESPTVPRKALLDERNKRQTLEQQVAELNQRMAQFQQPPREPPPPPPSMWDDEQGWQQHFGQQVVGAAVSQATLNARLDMSEMMVRQANPDFEEKKAAFLELMGQNPELQRRALSDPHPWNFAYTFVKNHERMQELEAVDLSDLETKLREKIKAEMEAELKGQLPAQVPPTLSADRNVGSRNGPAWAGPASMDDLLS